MAHDELAPTARLRGLLEVTRVIRADDDVPDLLAAIARTISDSLEFRTVAISVYRPEWDDFCVTTVYGNERARAALSGVARPQEEWLPLLDERFLSHGAYFIPHDELDWDQSVPSYIPELEPSDHPDAWHSDDALLVPLRHADGHLLGIVSVDEPLSRRRPADDELDVLVAVADHAAIALQHAQEAVEAGRYRRALEQLLAVSSRLADASTMEDILPTVCRGISDALGLRSVALQLADPATGRLETMASVGSAPQTCSTLGELEALLATGSELDGCFLLETAGESRRGGRGPNAWRNNRLVVPLHDREGAPMGLIAADEPEDRLLPTRELLQALRVFANQATAAIFSARQFQELRFLADHDPLTRLLNRRAFVRRLEAEVARSERYSRAFSVVVCDLDGFKTLNDRYGHAAGDHALKQFGDSLQHALRRPDDAFRIGGDEFALLLAEASDEDALAVVERVAAQLARAADGSYSLIRASFGVASCPKDAREPQTLLRLADEALYRAKREGGTVQFAA